MTSNIIVLICCGLMASDAPQSPEAICGPRCVDHVLKNFGIPSPGLVELVAEIQGSVSTGSSFASLKSALENRGVHCRFVELGMFDLMDWREPVLMHVDGNHFVIVNNRNRLTYSIWDGRKGNATESCLSLNARSSLLVLLTSSAPISDEPQFRSSFLKWIVASLGTGLFVLGITLLRTSNRRHRTLQASKSALQLKPLALMEESKCYDV